MMTRRKLGTAPRAVEPSTVALMLNGTRALVIDDNATNRLILREMLASRGAEVSEAEDGPQGSALDHASAYALDDGTAYALDASRVRRSFDRAAATFDAAAVLHTEVRDALLARLDLMALTPRVVMDAGAGCPP